MKNTFFLFSLITLLVACSNEIANKVDLTPEQKLEFSAKNFVNTTIAYEKNDEIKLGVDKDDLLNSFNDYSKKFEIGSDAKSYLIEEIDGKNYLRFYHKDNNGLDQVSTVALIMTKKDTKNSLVKYKTGLTTCTTTVCNNCCGCVPDGSYCTRCQLDTLACTRTTTGGNDPISD